MPPGSLSLKSILRLLQEADPSSALFRRACDLLKDSLEVDPAIPKATGAKEGRFLTIGMVARNDFDGFFFSIQAIRLYHPEILNDVEFLVIDNDPAGPCAKDQRNLSHWCTNYRYIPYRTTQGSAVRDLIFREAAGDFVLCIDSGVLFSPGALLKLIEYCRNHSDSNDLLHGVFLSDTLEVTATGEADGLRVFACRREAWPGFNPRFSGYGGLEGYLPEKIRRAGGRTLCLPFLQWVYRAERPESAPHECSWQDRIRNYLLVHDELGLDPNGAIPGSDSVVGPTPSLARDPLFALGSGNGVGAFFRSPPSAEHVQPIVEAAQAEFAGPFHFLDGIYCINLDRRPDRWQEARLAFQALGIERRVRRFPAADTPLNRHIGCALSHRRIVAEAKLQQLQTVLIFEDNGRFSPETIRELQHLQHNEWQIAFFDGPAIAYHHTAYDTILNAVPDDPIRIARLVANLEESDETMPELFSRIV